MTAHPQKKQKLEPKLDDAWILAQFDGMTVPDEDKREAAAAYKDMTASNIVRAPFPGVAGIFATASTDTIRNDLVLRLRIRLAELDVKAPATWVE